MTKKFEVPYEVTTKCISIVEANSAEEALKMFELGESIIDDYDTEEPVISEVFKNSIKESELY